jgi:hypothetical protein
MTDQHKAALFSFLRVFAAAVFAQIIFELGHVDNNIFALDGSALQMIVSAGVSAVALTAVNWFRPGETNFGRVPPAPEPVKPAPRKRAAKKSA